VKHGSEINTLKIALNAGSETKVINAVKQVIAVMTIGKDVSSLFSDVVRSIQTENMELKKLIYLYVINYARSKPDDAVLVVHNFQNDARNPNPLIRALALRTMGYIRVDRVVDHLCESLNECISDKDPYVRKTAAICVAKLYHLNSAVLQQRGFLEKLRDLVGDDNPMVVSNAVASLAEISESSGVDVIKIDQRMLSKLLVAMNECAEWGQVFILDCLSKYEPNADEAIQVIERVSPRLKHSNTAVSLSAVKVLMKFVNFVEDPNMRKTLVYDKLPQPLITLLGHAQPEIQYVALRNINLICQRDPTILSAGINHFFCKYNDPIYVKLEKLEIMIQLATEHNIDKALMEFKEYATEVDVDFVRKSVLAIGRCAIKIAKATERCIKVLIELIQTKVNYVVQEAIIVIRDIFRKYPNKYLSIIGTLCENLDSLDEPKAKAAMVWIIGEYANHIDQSPELLEMFVDSFEHDGIEVQHQCLTAVVKLFLRRPDDGKEMVQKVLHLATEKSNNPDLRDRGFVYWRLLSSDPDTAQAVVLSKKPVISDATYQLDPNVLDVLIRNLNTLASIYHQPPEFFTEGAKASIVLKPTGAKSGDDDSSSSSSSSSSESGSSSDSKTKDSDKGPASSSSDSNSEEDSSASDSSDDDAGGAKIIMTAKQGKGIQINGRFLRRDKVLYLDLTILNKTNRELNQFLIKFNKNYLGIAPKSSKIPINLSPGGSADYALAIMDNGPLQPEAKVGYVQMALKTELGVCYFQEKLPAYMLFHENGLLEKKVWLTKWKQIQDIEENVSIKSRSRATADKISQKLTSRNIFHIATRELDGQQNLYWSISFKGTPLLLEIKIVDVNCTAAMKSENISFTKLGIAAIQELLQS